MSKPKGKGKAAAATPPPESPSASTTPSDPLASLSVPALSSHVASLQSRLLQLRQSRALLQQESSLLLQQHSTLLSSNTLAQSHLTNVASATERLSETSRAEVRVYQQKTVHLEFAHEAAVAQLEQHQERLTAELADSHQQAVVSLNATLAEHYAAAAVQSGEDEEEMRRLRETNKKELSKLKENFDKVMDGVDMAYRQKVLALQQAMELRCKLELCEVEERRNAHIAELTSNFDKSWADIKAYYQQITADNISLIKQLQAEIVDIKHSQEKKEKQIIALTERNTQLNTPLQESNKTKQLLQQQLANYDKNRTTLAMLRQTTKKKRGDLARLRDKLAQLERTHAQLHEEVGGLVGGFGGVLEEQGRRHEAEVRPLAEELRVQQEVFEHKRAQFQSVLRASGLEGRLVVQLTEKLDGLLGEKGRVVEGLLYEVDKCKKAYDDMRRTMEAKMEGFGVKRRERSKRERRMDFVNEGRGTQPADLILR